MKRTSISSLIGFLVFFGIFVNLFLVEDDTFDFGLIFPILIGFGALSSIIGGISKQYKKNNDESKARNTKNYTNVWETQQKQQQKCEYCGESNDIDREYCAYCGAKQL